MGYQSLRDYLDRLRERGLLVEVAEAINKDTELVPLVRLEFRGLPEDQRKAFWFHRVTDSRGRSFTASVAMGALAASRAVYATALDCAPQDIEARWQAAQAHPLPPRRLSAGQAPVKAVVRTPADDADGIDGFPHPISTPGFDPAPFLTAGVWVTRDPEGGGYNLGIYRGMVKAPWRIGCATDVPTQHLAIHWQAARRQGRPLPAAVVVGGPPALLLAAASKVPYGVDEYALAGALNGAPLDLVPAETVDLLVPAQAELVIEGHLRTDVLEPEAPFGEASGYVGPRKWEKVFEITAISHRPQPIVVGILSEFPPSESSLMRKIAFENVYRRFLREACNIPSLKRVAVHEMGSSNMVFVLQLDHPAPGQAWQALHAAAAFDASMGKLLVAVDSDVDPDDWGSVLWALSYGMQPHRDVRVLRGKLARLDPSVTPSEDPRQAAYPEEMGTSCLLINAVREHPYPPVSLPAPAFMENALRRWQALALPALSLRQPWYGYPLGAWSAENQAEAEAAVAGRYLETGEKLARLRRPVAEVGD